MPLDTHHLASVLASAQEELGIPGVAVGVLDGGESWRWSGGVTNLDHPLPVTAQTIFQIGSISKTFAGTAAMALVDDGRLDLDVPIRTYLPDLRLSSPELTDGVTMKHLLTHAAGWVGDYFADTGMGDDALALFVAKLVKAPQVAALGEAYSYSNSGFNLAAHVVATVAGCPYERAVKDLVLQPLGMSQTFYKSDDAITQRVAVGHRGNIPQPWRRPRAHCGAGGVLSCVDDLLRYTEFHLGDGTPIMSTANLDLMHAPARPAGSLCDEVGLVWMIDHHGDDVVVHHGGTTNGYQADLRLVPGRDLGWVMLTNCDHYHQLDPILKAALLGPEPVTTPWVPDDLGEYTGRYEAALADLALRVDGGVLVLDVGTPVRAMWNPSEPPAPPIPTRLSFRDADRVVATDMPWRGHRGEFVRGSDGAIRWFRWDGRLARPV